MDNILSYEEASKYWDLSNIDRPVWVKDSGNTNEKLIGCPVGHLRECGELTVQLHGIPYNYSKLKNYWKYGYYTSENNALMLSEGFHQHTKIIHKHALMVYRVGTAVGYENVTLHQDWYDFKEWFLWAKDQKGFMSVDINGRVFEQDKDLFSPDGNLCYSPSTCCFIPRVLNSLVKVKTSADKLGVQYFERKKKQYRAYGNRFGKVVGLGYFETREEAEVVSSKHRLSYLEDLYGIYKCSVDEKVWDALRELHTP